MKRATAPSGNDTDQRIHGVLGRHSSQRRPPDNTRESERQKRGKNRDFVTRRVDGLAKRTFRTRRVGNVSVNHVARTPKNNENNTDDRHMLKQQPYAAPHHGQTRQADRVTRRQNAARVVSQSLPRVAGRGLKVSPIGFWCCAVKVHARLYARGGKASKSPWARLDASRNKSRGDTVDNREKHLVQSESSFTIFKAQTKLLGKFAGLFQS